MFKEIKNIFKKDKTLSKSSSPEKEKINHTTKQHIEHKEYTSNVPKTENKIHLPPKNEEHGISPQNKRDRDIKFKPEYMDNGHGDDNPVQKHESRSRLQSVASRNTEGTHGSSIVSLDSTWVDDDDHDDYDEESEVSRNIDDELDLDEIDNLPQKTNHPHRSEKSARHKLLNTHPQSLKVNRHLYPEQNELNEYLLLDKIGEGAFSQVYKSVKFDMNLIYSNKQDFEEDEYDGEYVAIKIINKEMLDSTNSRKDKPKITSREQVLKEIMIHKLVSQNVEFKPRSSNTNKYATLNEEILKRDVDTNSEDGPTHIVRFVDFIETDSYYYIVQELVTGGEIFGEVVKYTYFSEDLSRFVVRQLAFAIKHLHKLGVVHRDIKLENLLFETIPFFERNPQKHDPDLVLRASDDPQNKLDEGIFIPGVGAGTIGIVKLADFGLSKKVVNMTGADLSTPCGTVGYTAPEVVRDERYSFQVDLWGIGCVLYTVLCGFPPFYDEKIDVLTEKISKGDFNFLRPWWDEISDGAKHCVSRLLEIDPLKRYTIEELLADPWFSSYDCTEFYSLETQNRLKKLQTKVFDRRLKRVLKKQEINRSSDIKTHKKSGSEVDDDFVMTIPIKSNLDTSNNLLYSPAAVAMRDAFDITNAVQRIKEENSNIPENNSRNMTKQAMNKNAANKGLPDISEDNEVHDFNDYANAVNNNALDTKFFQLKLNSSTIVKRRHNGVDNGNKVKTKSPLSNLSS
ncbi:hypothetical protein ACO0R3_002039 [Hanseniaspora guilliermondii]